MAQHSQLPKFGNWESGENVPYTEYFDNATKHRSGGKVNPKGPYDSPVSAPSQQDTELKGQMGTIGPAALRSKHEHQTSHEDGSGSCNVELEAQKGSDVVRPRQEHQLSREEVDLKRSTESRHETVGWRATVDSHHHHGSSSAGDAPKKVTRQSVGSERSIDHSPLHPRSQATVGGKLTGVSSPSWERKGSSEGHGPAPSTPGRSRLRSVTRGDDTPDHSPAVPKFGDWDESDPASAETFTQIFNKVREEKQSGAGKVPAMPTETPYSNGQKQYANGNSKSCCCFPWGRK